MMTQYSEEFRPVAGAIRFGSADSLDCDVLYEVQNLPDAVTCKEFCSGSRSENRNLMVIRDGCVVETYKGLPDENNNALLATYSLHHQTCRLPVTTSVLRNVPLKVVRAVRVILSQVTRTAYREEAKAALSSNNAFQRIECLAKIDFDGLDLGNDATKSIAYQLTQTIAIIEGQELYTKADVKKAFPECTGFMDRLGGSLQPLNRLRDNLVRQLRGVYVRQKGDLNLFMYGNALAIDDWNLFARQCRGMIIDIRRERCVCFPMDKFFRFGEGPEQGREDLALDTQVEVVEKADGSMVSLVWHDQKIAFSCKGNFDTAQSRRAMEIAHRLPVSDLQLDRFYHVFEVIYPENRYPSGLSIVDYGAREDLVLTAMRDKATNRLLSYAEVIAEARRVGLSHPAHHPFQLPDAFREVDNAPFELRTEGFVIRTVKDGRYFKLKYPAYKEVLRIVNDLRSDRFVREYFAQSPAGREHTLTVLPKDICAIAESEISVHQAICSSIKEYANAVVQKGPNDKQEFAAYVNEQIPEPFRKLVFQISRGGDSSLTVEKLATAIYYGQVTLPGEQTRYRTRCDDPADLDV